MTPERKDVSTAVHMMTAAGAHVTSVERSVVLKTVEKIPPTAALLKAVIAVEEIVERTAKLTPAKECRRSQF